MQYRLDVSGNEGGVVSDDPFNLYEAGVITYRDLAQRTGVAPRRSLLSWLHGLILVPTFDPEYKEPDDGTMPDAG